MSLRPHQPKTAASNRSAGRAARGRIGGPADVARRAAEEPNKKAGQTRPRTPHRFRRSLFSGVPVMLGAVLTGAFDHADL